MYVNAGSVGSDSFCYLNPARVSVKFSCGLSSDVMTKNTSAMRSNLAFSLTVPLLFCVTLYLMWRFQSSNQKTYFEKIVFPRVFTAKVTISDDEWEYFCNKRITENGLSDTAYFMEELERLINEEMRSVEPIFSQHHNLDVACVSF